MFALRAPYGLHRLCDIVNMYVYMHTGPSSNDALEESDVGTSSEAADLLLDYMQVGHV